MKYLNKYVAVIILILISATLLIGYNVGIYKTFDIDLNSDYSIVGSSDATHGGATTIQVEKRDEGIYFKCNIIEQIQWPYCQLKIHLGKKDRYGSYEYKQGVDLSQYDEMFIDADFKGSKPERLRVYIRNYNPAYTDFSIDKNSMKVNVLRFSPNAVPHGQYFKLSEFNVASWWSNQRQLPTNLQGEEFTNVPLIEIVSAGNAEDGELEVLLRKITFRAHYICQEDLLLAIIIMWVSSALIYLLTKTLLSHSKLKQAKKSQQSLQETMNALKVEKNEIDKIAKRDALTNLRNRAGLDKHFSECSLALIEKQVPFSIIFIDIDFFKQINDIHGHNMGDDILVSFSQLLHKNIRIEDKLARWGGEEFMLICKNSRLANATASAENLCRFIEKSTFANNLKITASFGVAEMRPTESITQFIERADKALYKAKSNGRNQVQSDK